MALIVGFLLLFFFLKDIWAASVICVWKVDGLGMKVMEWKRCHNENLCALAFDAKQMQQSAFLSFFFPVGLLCCYKIEQHIRSLKAKKVFPTSNLNLLVSGIKQCFAAVFCSRATLLKNTL